MIKKKDTDNAGRLIRRIKKDAVGISAVLIVSLILGMTPDVSFAALTDLVDSYSDLFKTGNEMTPQDASATDENAGQTIQDGEQTEQDGEQTEQNGDEEEVDPNDGQTTQNGDEEEVNPDDEQTMQNGNEEEVNPDDNQTTQNGEETDSEPEEEPDSPYIPLEPDIQSNDDFVKFYASCPDYIVDLSATTSIKPNIRNANKKYTIKGATSDNTKVAKVGKDGKVTLVGAGDATITLKLLSQDNEPYYLTFCITATGKITSSSTGTSKVNNKINISKASFKLAYTSVGYCGKKRTPTVTVTYAKKTLKNNTDYTVSYSSNINVGKAVVTIKGKGSYTGQKKLTFIIKPLSIAKAKVTLSQSSISYNGKNMKPFIKQIVVGGTKLNSTNYSVTYSKDTRKPGIKNLIIKGRGNYTGTIKKNYVIKPAKVSGVTKTSTINDIKIKWKKVSGVAGYEVYKFSAEKSKFVKVAITKSNSFTDKNLTTGTKCYYKVRTFIKSGNTTIYGDFSDVIQGITKPARVTIQFKLKGKNLTVMWKAIPGASGYEVYMSTGKQFSFVADTKKLKFIKNDLKRGNKYSFKIRSYVKDSKGKKVYSDFGTTKSIKI